MQGMWFVGLDVHSETTAVSIRSARGIVVVRQVVATNAAALRRALSRTRGRVKIACESGPLAAWLTQSLQTQLREVIVCDRRRLTFGSKEQTKTDRSDADRLSACLQSGAVNPVYVPAGHGKDLRRYARHYVRMIQERHRAKQRLKALFLEAAVRLPSGRSASKRVPTRLLPKGADRDVARAYARQLELANELVDSARVMLMGAAAAEPAFELLQTIPYVGRIRAAMLLGTVVTITRFPGRRKFWSYCGLGVIQRVSSEHRIENGLPVRESRTRGVRLSRCGQPLLKKVLLDVALHASSGRGELRALFERHLARGKRPAVARLALARKIASIVMAVWRTGKPYKKSLVNNRKKASGRASRPPLSRGRATARKATALSICRPEGASTRSTS